MLAPPERTWFGFGSVKTAAVWGRQLLVDNATPSATMMSSAKRSHARTCARARDAGRAQTCDVPADCAHDNDHVKMVVVVVISEQR